MYKQITIKTLKKQGSNNTEIARQLSCHRNTVLNVLQRENVVESQTRQKGWLFDPYEKQIKTWREEKISILRIYELLQETYGIKSSYVNLCKYMSVRFPKEKEAFGVQVHLPGETAEIDFGEVGLLPGVGGKPVRTFGLAVILPYSRLDFYAICYDQKLETLLTELRNAFLYFGGVPKRLKVDNMKTAILKNQHYELEFNQNFLEFAYHYSTVIIPCTPYSPEQKGTVESGIKYLQGNFIAGRTFQDDIDIKKQLRDWTDNYANKRTHGTTKKIPREVFEALEKEKLQPLPEEAFSFFNRGVRKVATNCHIHFENNYYSVPAVLIEKEVTVRWNEHLLRIIYSGEQVALHHKPEGIGKYVTLRHHMPDYKVYSQTEYQKRYESQMADIGDGAHEYFQMLLREKESYWFRVVRVLLGLAAEYGQEAVNLTLKRALYYKATDVTTIKNILEKKLYLLPEEPRLLGTSQQRETQGAEQPTLVRELAYYETNRRDVS